LVARLARQRKKQPIASATATTIGKDGKSDAAGEGVLLDDVNFYKDD
jgi:hypothetical protein